MKILAVILSLAGAVTLRASSGYDLLLGFTMNGKNSTGNDFILDIGPTANDYVGAVPIVSGQTWNLNSTNSFTPQNFNLANVQWGVIGDAGNDVDAPTNTLWVTTYGTTPPSLPGPSQFNQADTGINDIEQQDFGGGEPGYLSNEGQTCTPSTTGTVGPYSWSVETSSGTGAGDFIIGYANPNVIGVTTATLWQVPVGFAPIKFGTFTLNSSGMLAFNLAPVGTPPSPKIVKATRAGSTSTIYFTTANGFTYTLYFTNSAGLTAPVSAWPASPATIYGNGLTNNIPDTTSTTNRFYLIGAH